jgi:uncharacterized protein YfbU (UPF0304 family)
VIRRKKINKSNHNQRYHKQHISTMDILPSGNIFRELQVVHETGYFISQSSIEDQWQQVCNVDCSKLKNILNIY